jgi:subtilase family serine protease
MKRNSLLELCLVSGLMIGFNTSITASPFRVFDPPERGTVRPPLWIGRGPDARPQSTGSSTSSSTAAPYTPQQVQTAYGFSQLYTAGTTGTGQTIAIVDAYDDSQYVQNDLNTFCSEFGIPSTTVEIIYAAGSQPAANSGWQQEMSLDVQWAHAIAPGAKILLVEAAGSSTASLLQAVQVAVKNGATVVSMSWGGGEFAGETAEDSNFTAPGVTFVASAGDSGAGVEWPAASPNVTGVGGTSLILNSSGGYGSETAWADGGGGISVYETPQPVWQQGWFPSSWTPVNRGVPDVAYLADPNYGVYVVYKGQWYEFGGTSVGAPQWSALVALSNQGRTSGSLSGIGNLVYSIANGGGYSAGGGYSINSAYFHDITAGSDGGSPDDTAGSGYDLVTGVGSPLAGSLVPALRTGNAAPPPPAFALAVSPSSQTVPLGAATTYTVTVSASGGYDGTVNLSVSGLPTGVTETFSPPSITSSGSATLTIQTTSTAPVGTYTLTLTGTDGSGTTHSVNATLVIGNSMSVSLISYSLSELGRTYYLSITLKVVNDLGNPVSDASISITLNVNGSAYASGTAATGSNGEVVFTLANPSAVTYSAVVTAVKATGLTWNGEYPANSYTP